MKFVPHNYQDFAFEHIIQNKYAGVFMDMGLGKTVVTLTAINRILYEDCDVDVNRFLVIGTKRIVRNVWMQEAKKWDHLKHLKFSLIWGSPEERMNALKKKADIYLINRENVVWLTSLYQSKFPFPAVVIDESSSFKNQASQRFRAMKMVKKQLKRLVLLTGTPAPNGLLDLWSQMFLLDEGERLEKNITGYRERYFTLKNPGERYSGYRLRKGAAEEIYNKIGDLCISMKSEDYLDLPPLIENDIFIELDADVRAKYEEFEEEKILEIADKEITAVNSGALNIKLMQFANGAVYHEDRTFTKLHDSKLDALQEIIDEANGQPVLVGYAFQHDLKRIKERFPYARQLNTPKDENDWNEGKIQLAVGHPASMSHGLNLQFGGHIAVWFGLTWNLEFYQQFIKRLHRQGQLHPVILHRLIAMGTIDEDAAISLRQKEAGQDALMRAIKARVNKYKNR